MKYISLIVLCTLWIRGYSQNAETGKITVTIVNEKKDALENGTVELLKTSDSSLVKIAITDKSGIAEFEKIYLGSYLLRVSLVNYAITYSAPFDLSAAQKVLQLPVLVLHTKSTQMGEVVVTSRKPFIQKLSDRIVVNVENSIVSAGS
ncbi:MAG: carboxypeptidase-like regulatory domain-containing protein, partial [Bacteroidota bacterium]